MAADRFWGGIPAGAYSHENFTFMASAEKNTYLDSVTIITATALKTSTWQLMGTKKGDTVTSALMDPITVGSLGNITIPLHIELEPGTICYMLVTPEDGDSVVSAIRTVLVSGTSRLSISAFISGKLDCPAGNHIVVTAALDPAGADQVVMETPIATHAIDIPAMQATPAAIDELELVSDSASDTQDIIIDYWDEDGEEHSTDPITMTGTTEVTGLAATYDDIWVVKGARVASGGAAAVGNIVITDASA